MSFKQAPRLILVVEENKRFQFLFIDAGKHLVKSLFNTITVQVNNFTGNGKVAI
jgi:hypothetical protein